MVTQWCIVSRSLNLVGKNQGTRSQALCYWQCLSLLPTMSITALTIAKPVGIGERVPWKKSWRETAFQGTQTQQLIDSLGSLSIETFLEFTSSLFQNTHEEVECFRCIKKGYAPTTTKNPQSLTKVLTDEIIMKR